MYVLKIGDMPNMLKSADRCPGCDSKHFYSSANEAFCKDCLLVIIKGEES